MNLLTSPENGPFHVAFILILAIAVLEGLGMLLSLSPSSKIDGLLPEVHGEGVVDHLLGWLHIGRVPALVVMLLFLMGFAFFGYSLQWVVAGLFAHPLPAWVAGFLAVPAGLANARGLGAIIGHLVPRDETSAVSEATLIGRVGVISAGVASRGRAAQARVKDALGRTHYLMVEPDIDTDVLEEGAQILIVRKAGAFFRAIANPHPTLMS